MIAKKNRSCAACLSMQEELRRDDSNKAACAKCPYGLSEAAVPVRMGDELIGYLQTGQVLTETPTPAKVAKVVEKAKSIGLEESSESLRKAYLSSPVIDRNKLNSTLRLLSIFADLLAIKSDQIVVKQSHSEHPVVTKAKQYIEQNHAEDLSLSQAGRESYVAIGKTTSILTTCD